VSWPKLSLFDTLSTAKVFVDGDWVESKDQDPDGDVRLIQLADIGDGYYIDKSNRFLTSSAAERLKCTFLEPGDVLIARMPDPLGRACIFPGDAKRAVTVVDVCVIRVDPARMYAPWLVHCINSSVSRNQIDGYVTGTTRQRISRGNLGKIEIAVPPLHEQRRIAAILDQADALRAKRREVLVQLDGLTQSIFFEMFGDPVTNPKKFRVATLSECTETIQIGPFGTQLHEEDYVDGGVPLVNPTHIKAGKICPDWSLTVTQAKYSELSNYYLDEGDLILGRRGEMGRCAVVTSKEQGWLCGTGSLFVRPNTNLLHPIFLELVISSPSMRHHLENVAQGVTMANLNKTIVGSLPIPLPSINKQLEMVSQLDAVEGIRVANRQSSIELDTLFASLQHRAFGGDL